MKPDERSMRIALTADRYLNPPPGGLDALAVLAPAGWGVMALPPEDYPEPVRAGMLAEVADQVAEFSRGGYEIVLVGEPGGLGEALAAHGLPLPGQVTPDSPGELSAFLSARPAPAAAYWERIAEAERARQPKAARE